MSPEDRLLTDITIMVDSIEPMDDVESGHIADAVDRHLAPTVGDVTPLCEPLALDPFIDAIRCDRGLTQP